MRPEDPLDYVRFFLDAYRGIVRRALAVVAAQGLPDGHDFYFTFRTQAPGVVLPTHLQEQYPELMTVVIEHEYWDLQVEADSFTVTLMFSRVPTPITISFDSLVFFEDRQIGFQLRFLEPDEMDDPALYEGEDPDDFLDPEDAVEPGGVQQISAARRAAHRRGAAAKAKDAEAKAAGAKTAGAKTAGAKDTDSDASSQEKKPGEPKMADVVSFDAFRRR